VLMSVSLIGGAVMRAAGDTRTPMLATAVANVVNAVVAYLLIFGGPGIPALGAVGSAWGMVAARLVAGLILLAVLARGVRGLTVAGGDWRPDLSVLRRVVRFGAPSVAEQVLLMGSFMTYARIAMELGTVAFATQRITFNAITISFLPAMGFSIAAATLTGQSLGARRPDLAERTAWAAVRSAAVWMGAMALVFFFLGDALLRIFTDDPTVHAMGVPALRIVAIASTVWAIPIVLSGALRGAGDTRFPMWVSFITGWLIRVPLAYLFGITLEMGLPGVYLGMLGDAVVGTGLMIARYRRGGWREVRV
jgi:MATE family multidrug resistance protein